KENLLAAQESGIRFLTLHPRTKVDGYGPPARWDLIAEAKSLLKIPVVGNGDILQVQDAVNMLERTHCDALMIGRGSIINPFIFHQIRAHFTGFAYQPEWSDLERYFEVYLAEFAPDMPSRGRINKMKQLLSFFFKGNAKLVAHRDTILRSNFIEMEPFLNLAIPLLQEGWRG
ncbi:MAG TPA: tRNA-dihydrouridine synthase family protein, partial [Rhabdochlamydiaceae bacterium]